MSRSHILGFPRIGAQRELKFAVEAFWRNEITAIDLSQIGADLRKRIAG
jgi:5-methyltetrahydropteroyltriglutamate--homocysteine methyltransferase